MVQGLEKRRGWGGGKDQWQAKDGLDYALRILAMSFVPIFCENAMSLKNYRYRYCVIRAMGLLHLFVSPGAKWFKRQHG